jgi:hypothetical protein
MPRLEISSNKPPLFRSGSERAPFFWFRSMYALSFMALLLIASSGHFFCNNDSYEQSINDAPNMTKLTVPGQPQSSQHATVMGMATGLPLNNFKAFVGTLRDSGFQGHIILVVDEPALDVRKYLTDQNVTMKFLTKVNCTFDPNASIQAKDNNPHHKERYTCAHPYPSLKLRWGRFALLRDYLKECIYCTGPVLVTDVRDTFFQRDLFGPEAPPVVGLQVFEEQAAQRTTHWLTKGPIEQCKKTKIFDEVMLCSGTTIGTRQAMLDYLDAMVEEMHVWMLHPDCCCHSTSGDDQSIHNYLYYTGKLGPHVSAIPNAQGLVNTVGFMASYIHIAKRDGALAKNMTIRQALEAPYTTQQDHAKGKWLGDEYGMTDAQGYFRNINWERSFVVHQYDRFGQQLEEWLWNHGPAKGQGNPYSYP